MRMIKSFVSSMLAAVALILVAGSADGFVPPPGPPVCVTGPKDASGGCWIICPNVPSYYSADCRK